MAHHLRIWEQLSPELEETVLSFLDANEVAGTVRLVCKAAATRYPANIRLSQSVPPHTFAHRWGAPGALRSLSHKQRTQLLRLTASSGCVRNMRLLLPILGIKLSADIMTSAAAAGHRAMCQWLRDQGCPWYSSVLEAAGGSGSRVACNWLIVAGCPGGASSAMEGAAGAGHVGLLDHLLSTHGPPENPARMMAAIAKACDMPTMCRLHALLVTEVAEQVDKSEMEHIVMSAACGASPDWREKLQWLEARGYPSCPDINTVDFPDALERLKWLVGHGWQLHHQRAGYSAASLGLVEVFDFVLGPLGQKGENYITGAVEIAAYLGHVPMLQYLHAQGDVLDRAACEAAECGHRHVLAWLVDTLGAEEVLGTTVFGAAIRSGSLPLLMWLQERGCRCQQDYAVDAAVAAGCSEEVIDWLVAQGCILQLSAGSYVRPAVKGDMVMLAWLRRMGCPWATNGKTFTSAVRQDCPLRGLRWLAEAGCPVDWEAALRWTGSLTPPGVVKWLQEQQQQRPGRYVAAVKTIWDSYGLDLP